jgi:hypothetical protein
MSCHVNPHSFTISRQYSSRPSFLSALSVPMENLSTAFYVALMKAALGHGSGVDSQPPNIRDDLYTGTICSRQGH